MLGVCGKLLVYTSTILFLQHDVSTVTVDLHTFECPYFFDGSKYKIIDGTVGNIFCNFDGGSVVLGSIVRQKDDADTTVVTFSSSSGTEEADFVGRATVTVNDTGINVQLPFNAATEDVSVIKCDIVPAGTSSLDEIDILPALTSASIPDVNVADFDTDKTNEINADTDVTVTGTTSSFDVGSDEYPAGVITATQDGTAVSCSDANSCSVPVTCGSEEFTTTIEFTSTVFCKEKKTSVVLKCNGTDPTTTESPTTTETSASETTDSTDSETSSLETSNITENVTDISGTFTTEETSGANSNTQDNTDNNDATDDVIPTTDQTTTLEEATTTEDSDDGINPLGFIAIPAAVVVIAVIVGISYAVLSSKAAAAGGVAGASAASGASGGHANNAYQGMVTGADLYSGYQYLNPAAVYNGSPGKASKGTKVKSSKSSRSSPSQYKYGSNNPYAVRGGYGNGGYASSGGIYSGYLQPQQYYSYM